MSRPYTRKCETCGKDFTSKSNGRIYCYDCSPPQVVGRGRRDGKPGGTGLLETEAQKRSRMKGRGALPRNEDPLNEDPNRPDADKTLDPAIDELRQAEYSRRAGGKADNRIVENNGGDTVFSVGRPEEGWGTCNHIDPKTRREGVCVMEKFSSTTPFCFEHMQFWRDERQRRIARQVLEEEVGQTENFDKNSFKVKTTQEALDLLARINYAILRNWITVAKARALKETVAVQIKALDTKALEEKLKEALEKLKGEGKKEDMLSEEERQEDKDLADRAGISTEEETTDDASAA